MPRSFPAPWTVHHSEGSYWVQDANGHKFAFCYVVERSFAGSGTEHHLTADEARRITTNIAKLPELLKKPT